MSSKCHYIMMSGYHFIIPVYTHRLYNIICVVYIRIFVYMSHTHTHEYIYTPCVYIHVIYTYIKYTVYIHVNIYIFMHDVFTHLLCTHDIYPGSPKTIKNICFHQKLVFEAGNFDHPKLRTIILMVLDFQGIYIYCINTIYFSNTQNIL